MHPSPTLTLPTTFASLHIIVLRTTGEDDAAEETEGEWRGRTGEERRGEERVGARVGEVGGCLLGSAIFLLPAAIT